jgi:hypothetical protein
MNGSFLAIIIWLICGCFLQQQQKIDAYLKFGMKFQTDVIVAFLLAYKQTTHTMPKRRLAAMANRNDSNINQKSAPSDQEEITSVDATKINNVSKNSLSGATKDYHTFHESSPIDAKRFTDGVLLKWHDKTINTSEPTQKNSDVILPWLGFGTYKIGKELTKDAVINAIKLGYRSIGTLVMVLVIWITYFLLPVGCY